VTNDEPQITDISMIAYYYHDEQFNDKKECDDNSDDNSDDNENKENNDIEENDNPESESFFKNLLKKI
jgi:hypothetical protein